MKRLLLSIALAALAVSARAQVISNITNIRVTLLLTNGTTDNVNITPSANEFEGFLLDYDKQVMVANQQTNTPPTIQQAVKRTVDDLLLKPLAIQARANDQKTNKVDLFWQNGSSLWDQNRFTAQQKQDLKAIINSPNILTNLPAQ